MENNSNKKNVPKGNNQAKNYLGGSRRNTLSYVNPRSGITQQLKNTNLEYSKKNNNKATKQKAKVSRNTKLRLKMLNILEKDRIHTNESQRALFKNMPGSRLVYLVKMFKDKTLYKSDFDYLAAISNNKALSDFLDSYDYNQLGDGVSPVVISGRECKELVKRMGKETDFDKLADFKRIENSKCGMK